MAIQSICVQLNSDSAVAPYAEYAIKMADIHKAEVCGLFVQGEPQNMHAIDFSGPSVGDPNSVAALVDEAHDQARREIKKQTQTINTEIAKVSRQYDKSFPWRSVSGSVKDAISRESQFQDLVIVTKHNRDNKLFNIRSTTAVDVAISSACPILAIPDSNHASFLKRPLAVWDGSEASARTLKMAMPLLQKAESFGLVFKPKGEEPLDIDNSEQRVLHWLALQGLNPSRPNTEANNNFVDQIIALLDGEIYDSVIVGAHGHSHVSDLLFGSALRSIWENTKVPVYTYH